MYYLPTSLILIGYSIATTIYLSKNVKEKIEKKLIINELLVILLLLFAGITFPFSYQFHSNSLPRDTLNFLWFTTSLIFTVEMGVWAVTLTYNTIISKRNPDIMAERDYNDYIRKLNDNWDESVKSEFGRKILHLFTCAVIFVFWILGSILENIGFLSQFGLDNYSFSYWLIITVGF